MTPRSKWKCSPTTANQITAASGAIVSNIRDQASCPSKEEFEDELLNGPYLDNTDFGMTSEEEDEKEAEFQVRYDWFVNQTVKAARTLWKGIN